MSSLMVFRNILIAISEDAGWSTDALRKEAYKAAETESAGDPVPHLILPPGTRSGGRMWSVEYLYSVDGHRFYRKF